MTARFAFTGHETVAAHVARCLGPLGWERVGDVSQADVVFTYCTDLSSLEDAYFDGGGIVKNARPGTLLVDLSPATPSLARELSAVATVSDLRPVEAPIAVVDPAAAGAFSSPDGILCFAAGEQDDVDEAIDVLETIAATVERTGAAGTAQLAKAAHTAQAAAQVVAAIEADALFRATRGAATSLDRFDGGVPAGSPVCARMLAAALGDAFAGSYTIEMFMGEVAAAMTAADDVDLILPQLEAVMHLLEVIAVIGGADKAPAALSLIYREEAASAAHGLDWTRAESLFAGYGDFEHGHDHSHDHGQGQYEDDDDFGFFGGYSAN